MMDFLQDQLASLKEAGLYRVLRSSGGTHSATAIIDGCMMSKAQIRVYPHKYMDVLEDLLKESKQFTHKLIVTDGIFSVDGDILKNIQEILRVADDLIGSGMWKKVKKLLR